MPTCRVVARCGVWEFGCGREGVCVEEGLSMEHVRWTVSSVDGGDSCLE